MNNLDKYEILKVINVLVGNIEPVGETHLDDSLYEKQRDLEYILKQLIHKMMLVADYKDRPEYSVSRAGQRAYDYLLDIKEWIGEIDEDIG